MPWGAGLYAITVDIERALVTSPADAERNAYEEASKYCASSGENILVQDINHSQSSRYYTVKLYFRCGADTSSIKNDIQKISVEML